MKLNDFEKEYLIDSIFKELINRYQNISISKKNGVLGAMQYDNLIDEFGLQDLTSESKMPSANAFDGFERLRDYNHLFSNYVSLLIEKGNQTIYPSKESFLKNLFIKGKYTLLNFSYASEIMEVTFEDGEKGDIAIIGEQRDKNVHTRIRKGLTVRVFDFYIDSHEAFFSGKHLYTMSLENVSDQDFEKLFKASRFEYSNEDYNRYYEGDLNRFIRTMIEKGSKYDSEHSEEITGVVPSVLSSNKRNGFYFKDIESNKMTFKDESDTDFIPENGLYVGDCIMLRNTKIEIVDIIINSYREQLICYKKVQNND